MVKKTLNSFKYAFQGIVFGLQERNMKIHVAAVLLVFIFGFVFSVTKMEWAVLFLCIGGVIASELCNTAIEEICDVIAPLHDEAYRKMGKPKDLAAGAVLVSSMIALMVGLIIFVPHILTVLQVN